MRRFQTLLACCAVAALCQGAKAHVGEGPATDVLMTPGGFTISMRCVRSVAWQLLGKPADFQTDFDKHLPALEELAPGLVVVKSGNEALVPEKVLVALEPSGLVALVCRYKSDAAKFTLQAPLLDKLDALERLHLHFFDHRSFPRAAEPFAELEITGAEQSVAFTAKSADSVKP